MNLLLRTFVGGTTGRWRVARSQTLSGPALPTVLRVEILEGSQATVPEGASWLLRGVISYERYVQREERAALVAQQPELGRLKATKAALIPIRKSTAWWELTQEERRAILEDRSHHIATGLRYLPAIARRLHHGHDLGEPFDFLTWFEYAPEDAGAFEELLGVLRQTEEWSYVEREVDIRLSREGEGN